MIWISVIFTSTLAKLERKQMDLTFKIGNTLVGKGQPTFIIAEMSGNHGGDLSQAIKIVRAAKECGASALKLQTYRADTITINCDREDFLLPAGNPWEKSKTLYALYSDAYTPWEWHREIFAEARKIGLEVFSSPFDETAVDFLESLNACAYKIASPEITDIPLLEKVASTGKPVILSTGVSRLEDIELAMATLRNQGVKDIVLLKCTSAYPTPPEEINLLTIPDLAQRFHCLSGLSDHSIGIGVPVAAVALGATVIEKHLVMELSDETVDSFFSLHKLGFAGMVKEIRQVEKALGTISYDISPSAMASIKGKRSLYIVNDIKCGEVFSTANVRSIRPSFGMHPKYYKDILGKKAKKNLYKGDRMSWDIVED